MSAAAQAGAGSPEPLYGGGQTRRITIRDLAAAKERGERWPMLTAYDALTARPLRRRGHPGAAGRRLGRDGGLRL